MYRNPKRLFHGKRIDVLSIEVEEPGGGVVEREVVSHPGAVVILPFLDPETIVLIRNTRFVVGETLWELPAGTLEMGEEPIECAQRELIEETGYRASEMEFLFECYSTPGFCNERLHIFRACALEHVGQDLDEGEQIEVVPTPLKKALEMIRSGEIRDAKTIAAILYR